MSIFSKVVVPVAQKKSTKMSFNSSHITTSDFMQLGVSYYRHLVPNQKIDVNVSLFSRLAPMPVPTLGKCVIKNHCFFVPFSAVMPSWHDFITDTPHVPANTGNTGLVPFAHRFSVANLSQVFFSSPYVTSVPSGASPDVYVWTGSSSTTATSTGYMFTPRGRHVYKLLKQLGYELDPVLYTGSPASSTYVSALPLLCLLRVYLDFYYPSQYVGDTEYSQAMSVLKKDSSSGVTFLNADIGYMIMYISNVCYDADYFTSAFDKPFAPNGSLTSTNFEIDDISQYGVNVNRSDVLQLSNGSPVLQGLTAGGSSHTSQNYNISDYVLQSLHRLTDYLKRHQIVGSRAIDRFMARFGTKYSVNDAAYLIGSFDVPVDFGAVMSNAGTQDAALGDYAGQGFAISRDKSHFSYEANDYGMLIMTSSIIPIIGYVQGIDRNILHLSKLDFFTPEFDSLGTQAISSAELYSSIYTSDDEVDSACYLSKMLPKVFGFTPRYAEYKIQLDKLTGDFLVPRLNTAGMASDAWHLYRKCEPNTPNSAVHSKDFVFPSWGTNNGNTNQYDRIFDNTTGSADHFVLIFNFDITSYFPGRALFDAFDFDDDEGKKLIMEAGGVKVN